MFNFRELIELWRSDNLLDQALEDTYTMLESTQEMYRESVRSLRRNDTGEMKLNVYEKDEQVNRYSQEVRHKVLKHLAITGGANILPGLILTSIVIDMERIGDYTKNIMDLAVAHPRKLAGGRHEARIAEIETGVENLFDSVLPVFRTTDKEGAKQLINDNWWMLKACDDILDSLIKEGDDSLDVSGAVAVGLYQRYLKRVAAHLINIASSVVNPFEGIGFHPEKD